MDNLSVIVPYYNGGATIEALPRLHPRHPAGGRGG